MKNIVLITVDCLRYDRCGFSGHNRPTTPILDELASESLIFDCTFATGPYTTESFPGILAGEYSHNGSYYSDSVGWKALKDDSETLATHLRDQGYETIATLTNPHLVTERNFDRGFESFRNLRAGPTDNSEPSDSGFDFADLMYGFRERMRNYSTTLNPYMLPYVAYRYLQYLRDWPTVPGETVAEAFIDDLGDQSEPFFAWTHFMDLHAPLNPSSIRNGGLCTSNRTFKHLLWDTARAGRVHEPRYDTMYDSALQYVDRCIGSIVKHLKAQNQWDDTVLIVTGDHGEVLFDRNGIYGHPRHHLYDDLLHVPLLVRIPGEDGGRISAPFSLAWLHELIAEVLNLPAGDFPTSSGRESVFDRMDEESNPVVSDSIDERGHTIAIRDSRTKLISHAPVDDADDSSPLTDPARAYDYIQDPGERVPQDGTDYPDLQAQADKLHAHPAELPSIDGEFTDDVQQRLKDLGYRT